MILFYRFFNSKYFFNICKSILVQYASYRKNNIILVIIARITYFHQFPVRSIFWKRIRKFLPCHSFIFSINFSILVKIDNILVRCPGICLTLHQISYLEPPPLKAPNAKIGTGLWADTNMINESSNIPIFNLKFQNNFCQDIISTLRCRLAL